MWDKEDINLYKIEHTGYLYYDILILAEVFIVNDITNFCFRLLQEPYMATPAMPKTKFLMSLTICQSISSHARGVPFFRNCFAFFPRISS